MPPNVMRILIVEDNAKRIERFQAWKPKDVHLVITTSAGPALGLIMRDRGLLYAGVMLDHDLDEQNVCDSEIEFCGTQVTAAIIKNFSYEIPILIHSMNSAKSIAMQNRLVKADFEVTRIRMELLNKTRWINWLDEARENWECIQKL